MTMRSVAAAGALLLLLVLVFALFASRGQVAQPSPSASATPTSVATASSPAESAKGGPTATGAASPSPAARTSPRLTNLPSLAGSGTITGEVGYPSESRPELEVYAIDVRDRSRWFSVTTPPYAGQGTGGTASPSPDPGKVYRIQVPPGTYHVVAYIKDSPQGSGPGLYSQYVPCGLQASCSDHTLIEVTVAAGQTRNDIDPVDWYYRPGEATYPPRPTPR